MIYFRGCVAREKLTNVSEDTKEILECIRIPYKTLENEKCCGSFLLRTGFKDEAKEVMENTFKEIGNEKVLVSCAGCYKTFKEDYKEILGVEIDVIHTSQLFNELIENGIIQFEPIHEDVTYHDPCHLGRHLEEYDAPRSVISKTANLIEMEQNKEKSRCCGAGAGVRSAYPEITEEIATMRVEDAEEVGAKIIVTACPFCILNLDSACRDDKKVMDISEILLKALKQCKDIQ
ncbi:MAG: (Fe-S)-binding protein [Methanobacterium sp.]